MNRSRFAFFLLSAGLLVPIVSATLVGAVSDGDQKEDSLYRYLSVFSEVLSLVRRAYVEETSIETLFAAAMDGSTDALGPLSTYIPEAAAPGFRETLAVGTGRSGLWIARDRGLAFVVAAGPGSPGAAAGLQTGDLLTSVKGASPRVTPLWKIRAAFAGAVGTEVAVDYLRRGRPLQTTVTLAEYSPPPPSLQGREGASVLLVPSVDANAVAAIRELLAGTAERGEGSLIVDLRGCAGGDPEAAYGIADLFVRRGRLGELHAADGALKTFEGTSDPVWEGRLMVLTHRGTQGASEILAAILAQAAGAELVGQRTFGHAGRQALVDLSSGAQVYLTDAFYTGPDGVALDEGLVPGVVVTEADRTFADADVPLDDRILNRALELIRSEPEQKQAA